MNKIKGYKCSLCGDIIYKRNVFDVQPQCRCGNLSMDMAGIKAIYPNKYFELDLELGDGVDENVLNHDYLREENNYGIIHSNTNEDRLYKAKAEVLLLRGCYEQ